MRVLLALVIAANGGAPHALDNSGVGGLGVEGTEWVLRTSHGKQLRSGNLAGAELRLQGGVVLRINRAWMAEAPTGRQWWAHDLSVRAQAEGWRPLCEPHVDGTQYAVVLPGREEPNGSLSADPHAFAVSCTSGALAKCLRLGYEPWQVTPAGASMRPTYNSCVRMMRADYTGRGVPYTVDGRSIDVEDVHAIQSFEASPEDAFEAGWDEHGAVCVHHVRVADKVTLRQLEEAVPRLRGKVGAVCTEARARALGALVFNRSPLAAADPD